MKFEVGENDRKLNVVLPPPIAETGARPKIHIQADNTGPDMTALQKGTQPNLPRSLDVMPSLPLYKRAPREDEHGRPLSDFMMIIPKLRNRPEHLIEETVAKIERVLNRYTHAVVFADLNLKLNVLWVIVRPEAKVSWRLPAAINNAVPEALLVAQPAF